MQLHVCSSLVCSDVCVHTRDQQELEGVSTGDFTFVSQAPLDLLVGWPPSTPEGAAGQAARAL